MAKNYEPKAKTESMGGGSSGGVDLVGVVNESSVDAKGDILAASSDNTLDRLAVGANGLSLIASSAAATGLAWDIPQTNDRADMESRLINSLPIKAWTNPPMLGGTLAATTDGRIHAVKIWVPETISVTGMGVFIGATLLTLPDNENALALFDSAGTLIGKTADQGAAWGAGASALKYAALASGPFTVTGGPGVYVYGAILVNTNGGATPTFYAHNNASSTLNNLGQSATATTCTFAFGYKDGLAAVPATANGLYTLSQGGQGYWIVLY